jgi:hypothetical protein
MRFKKISEIFCQSVGTYIEVIQSVSFLLTWVDMNIVVVSLQIKEKPTT